MRSAPEEVRREWRRWLGVKDGDPAPDVDYSIDVEYRRHRASGRPMSAVSIMQRLQVSHAV